MKRNSLLLGKGGRVLDVIGWMKAINLTYFRGEAVFVLEYHSDEVRSVSKAFKIPSVIMLTGSRDKHTNENLTISSKNIFMRDNFVCQWCGKKLTASSATVDHVFPMSRGGTNTWRNVVTCCFKCNNDKNNLTGTEYTKRSQKKLMRKPFIPRRGVLFRSYLEKEEYEGWFPYLKKYFEKK